MTYLNFSFNLLPVAIFTFFFFNDPATTEFSPLPLHAALPISFRHLPTQDLMTKAEIIGYNSAGAMKFKDNPAATATLSALTAKEDIVTAVLYRPDGKIFAYYFRGKTSLPAYLPSHLQGKGYRFEEIGRASCRERV